MKKHLKIFYIPYASDDLMSEELTARIADAAADLGIPPESLMAQYTVSAMCAFGAELTVIVEFFVEPAPARTTHLQA